MIEIAIERWTNAEGKTDFRWSVWSEGHRIQMGENVHSRADDCEAQAVEFCWRKLGRKPDKVTRLYILAMIPDLDIYRSAQVLVKQHGDDAPIHAAMRADAMLDKGDLKGYVVWRRVLRAVRELRRMEPATGAPVQ